MIEDLYRDTRDRMEKSLDAVKRDFVTVRTGRASVHILDSVRVEYFGSQMAINQVASLSTPDARLIQIQPWDAGLVKAVEKAIQMANLGFNPLVDGKIVRIPLPDMSRERRQEFVKTAHRLAEEGRVHVRNVRRDAFDAAKKAKLTEDESKRLEKEVQSTTDKAIKDINDHLAHKEKELLGV